MLILIAILMAFILVAILVMITSVYQMTRDNRARFTNVRQKQMALDHRVDALESIVARMSKMSSNDITMERREHERGTDVDPTMAGKRVEPDTGTDSGAEQTDSAD